MAVQTTLPFDAGCLRPPVDLAGIMGDRAIEAAWSEDHAAIKAHVADRDLPGGVNLGERRAIYHLIRALEPRRVLEIGTHIGASTTYIARALGVGAQLTSVNVIDVNAPDGPWRQIGLECSPATWIERLEVVATVDFVTRRSLDYLARRDAWFDFIFLDGDHSASTVYREVSVSLQRLNKN